MGFSLPRGPATAPTGAIFLLRFCICAIPTIPTPTPTRSSTKPVPAQLPQGSGSGGGDGHGTGARAGAGAGAEGGAGAASVPPRPGSRGGSPAGSEGSVACIERRGSTLAAALVDAARQNSSDRNNCTIVRCVGQSTRQQPGSHGIPGRFERPNAPPSVTAILMALDSSSCRGVDHRGRRGWPDGADFSPVDRPRSGRAGRLG